MATCKECLHNEVCSGFTPTDLDSDVFDYCQKGITEEIPDIEKRCSGFKNAADVVEVVRCKDCQYSCFIRSCSKYECRKGCGALKYATDFCSYGERKVQE